MTPKLSCEPGACGVDETNFDRFNDCRNQQKRHVIGGNIVGGIAKVVLLATVAAATAEVGGSRAFAQYTPANTGWWGTEISAKEFDPAIRAAADALGLVRDTRLVIGQVNLLEYVGSGTMVDVESATPGRQTEVSKFSYAVALQ